MKNCYGVKNPTHLFDFKHSPAISVYAPNGMMKTSFAKALEDYSNDGQSILVKIK